MSAYVQLDKVNLYFPVSEESEVLTETDISGITQTISDQQSQIAYLDVDLKTAKENTTYEQVQIEGLEEISTVIEEKIMTVYNKLSTETFTETYNKIIELKDKQEAKDRAILDAYYLALDAQEAKKAREAAQEDYDYWYAAVNGSNFKNLPPNDQDYERGKLSTASGKLEKCKSNYQSKEENAINAYREARNMEPNKSGDYSMTSV